MLACTYLALAAILPGATFAPGSWIPFVVVAICGAAYLWRRDA